MVRNFRGIRRIHGRFFSACVLLNGFDKGFLPYSCLHETRLKTQRVQRHGAGFSVLSANSPCEKAERVVSLLDRSLCLRLPFCRQNRTLTLWRSKYRPRCVRHTILRCTGSIFPSHFGFCSCPAIVCKDLSAPGNTLSTRQERPGSFMIFGLRGCTQTII